MKIIHSELFTRFPEIIFGFSTKIGLNRGAPFYFNLSYTVGDNPDLVRENRICFFNELGLDPGKIAYQKQIHSDIISIVDQPGLIDESDAMITNTRGIGLSISSADCAPVFLYDKQAGAIAAVHSGWRGTEKKILFKTINKMSDSFDVKAENLYVFIGPSISQMNYEIGEEVADLFDNAFLKRINGKINLDVLGANLKMLNDAGIPAGQIEVSTLCSFGEKDLLHSYRRDGSVSGRSIGVIALAEKN